MCFSATASFVTAVLTGAVGVAAVIRSRRARELPLAGMPILFAVQQAAEGVLWLELPLDPISPVSSAMSLIFLTVAQVVWPVYTAIAVVLIEPSLVRKRLIFMCLAIGGGVSGYLAWWLVSMPYGAIIADGHIEYVSGRAFSYTLCLAYLAAAGLPLVLSSHRTVVALGSIVIVGAGTALFFYYQAMVSVWCFFAAAASIIILWHFLSRRRGGTASPATEPVGGRVRRLEQKASMSRLPG